MNRKRKNHESYSQYKENLKQEQIALDKKLGGTMVVCSSVLRKKKTKNGDKLVKVQVQGTYRRTAPKPYSAKRHRYVKK